MGIFGTYGAFQGLGKPSIKLEFEDNDELLAFQRRVDGGDGSAVSADPDLANYDQKRLDEAVANHNTIGWGMSDELSDGWTRLYSDAAPDGFDVMVKGSRPELRLGTYGWQFRSASDARLVAKEKKLKATKGGELEGTTADEETEKTNFYLWITSRPERITPQNFGSQLLRTDFSKPQKGVFSVNTPLGTAYIHISKFYGKDKHIVRHIGHYFNVLKRTLEDPFCVFESYNDKGHPCNVFAKCFDFDGEKIVSIISPIDPVTFDVRTAYQPDNEFNHLWNLYKKGGRSVLYPKTSIKDTNNLNGLKDAQTSFKIVEFHLPITITENGAKSCVSEEKSLGAYGDTYLVTDNRVRGRKEPEDIKAFKNFYFDKPTGVKFLKSNGDFDFTTPLTSDGKYSFVELKERYDDRWQDLLNDYLHSKYGNLVGRSEIKPLLEKDEYWQQLKAEYKKDKEFIDSLGRTANPAIYNNNDIMECRGLVPTYTILDDYSSFFEQAKTHTEFAGFGLDDTLKLITDICRKHWKDCAKIAQHLKGDCKLQSAFNLWHWMRYNIRYEYDREGREEVRTPLRVWADRHRGVDCDCLSVFAYCVLRCMGYNPAFELVAFRNKPQYSHIFINLDGIVVDRVWFIFNSRPPMVTKSTIYRINDINDLGKLF